MVTIRCPYDFMKKIEFLIKFLLLLLVFTACPIIVRAQSVYNPFEIKYDKYSQGRIAFSYIDEENKDIYVLDFGTKTVKPLITSPGTDEAPSWSRDGQKIVFQSDLSGDKEIYSANSNGSGLVQLTHSPGADENPSFSPDGKKIVFQSSRRDPSGAELYLMNVDGSEQTPVFSQTLEPKIKSVTPKFSPRGDELLFVSNATWPGWDLVIYNMETKNKVSLTEGLGSFIRPSWKGDGSAYAFSYRAGKSTDIWLAKKGSTTPENIIKKEGQSMDPCWHDQDENIFFVSEGTPGKEDFKLFIYEKKIDPNNNSKPTISISPVLLSKGNVRHPAWTPFPALENIVKKLKEENTK